MKSDKSYLKKLVIILAVTFALISCGSLSKSSYNGDLAGVKAHIKEGAQVNGIDKYGWTALAWATYYQYYNIVDYLLKNGADPNIQVKKGRSAIEKGSSPLVIATYYGKENLVRLLLKHRADPNIANASGHKPAYYAEKYNFQSILRLLTGKGAHINVSRDDSGKSDLSKQVILLKDGGRVIGKIINQTRDEVTIKTKYTTMTVKKSDIEEIKYK